MVALSDGWRLICGAIGGLVLALLIALILVPAAGLGLSQNSDGLGGRFGILVVEARVCVPGPSRPVHVEVYQLTSSGPQASAGVTSFLPSFELSPGRYQVNAVGRSRTAIVVGDQITKVTMGFTGVCDLY